MIDPYKYELAKAKHLCKCLRDKVCKNSQNPDGDYAKYCESLIMILVTRCEDARKEVEDRVLYWDYNR